MNRNPKHSVLVRALVIACSVAMAATATMQAQDAARTIEQTFQFDERGDADIEIRFQYGAAQWAQWKEQFGDHPDLLLRNLRYELAAAVLDDFGLKRDDVKRIATANVKARALARYRSNGQFTIEVPKNMKLVTGSGTEWAFTNSSLINGELVNMTLRAKLPAKARNVHYTPGNDFDQLVYSLELEKPKPKLLLGAGIGLVAMGIVLAGLSFIRTSSKPSLPPSASPPPLPPASTS